MMTTTQRLPVFLALLALLTVTRVGHFGSDISLPDASLAVFLMGGLWLGGPRCFAAYAAVAFGIDVFLAKGAVEAGWCLTPGYAGLVAAYGAVWLVGRALARTPEPSLARVAGFALVAVGAHFVIANLSFWAFSGYFNDLSIVDYALRVARYLPGYVASGALYLALGLGLRRLWRARAAAPGIGAH
jgi:hypothetical protein